MKNNLKQKVILIYGAFDLISVDDPVGADRYSPISAVQGKLNPPLGLLYLASVLEKENIDVSILDITLLPRGIEEAVEIIKIEAPILIGIYVCSFNLPLVDILISKIKNALPETTVVIGGPHVHYEPESVRYLNADLGMVSDGEYSFLELTKAVFNHDNIEDIPNLVRRINGKIKVNPVAIIEDLDLLPFPARHLWPQKCFFSPLLSGKSTSMMSSRGCVFDCAFCSYPNKGKHRPRSPKNVVDELRHLEKQGFRHVEFHDDFFNFDQQRAEEICNTIIEDKIRVKWTCATRVDFVNKSILDLMKKANCTHVKYGIESGSERVRNILMRKNISAPQIKKAIKAARDSGISTVGYFVLGMPGETLEEAEETVRFAKEINLDYVDFHIVVLIPGSLAFCECVQKKMIPADIWRMVAKGKEVPYGSESQSALKKLVELKNGAMREHYLKAGFLIREAFKRTRSVSAFLRKVRISANMLSFSNKYEIFCKKFNLKN